MLTAIQSIFLWDREQAQLEPSGSSRSGTEKSASLDGIVGEALRELSSTEARLSQLFERAAALASAADQERAQLQRFLEEFALEQTIFDSDSNQSGGGTGPLIDVETVRHEARALIEELHRSLAFRGNLQSALQIVRACREQFAEGRAFQDVQDTEDVRLQQAMTSAREDERRRLAREVHDGPAQVMANAIFAIEIAEQVARRAPDQVAEELSRVRVLLKDGVAEVRRFMFDLRPAMLQEQGLAPTLRRYTADYNRFFGKRVTLAMDEPLPPMTADQELTMFRIVQEALQNVHKHAMTDAASIELNGSESWLQLTISDEGRGFKPNAVVSRPGAGAGLPGMRERAKSVGAELAVESMAGAGTVIKLSMAVRAQTGTLRGGGSDSATKGGAP